MQAILVATPNWRGVIDIRNVSTLAVSSLRERHVCLEVNCIVLEVNVLVWVFVHRVCGSFEHAVLSVSVEIVDEANAVLVSVTHIFALVHVIVCDLGAPDKTSEQSQCSIYVTCTIKKDIPI